jgi:hypothetical protein
VSGTLCYLCLRSDSFLFIHFKIGKTVAVSNVAPVAKASEWDKETVVTFSEPVEVPGKELPAGTYVVRLAESNSSRDIVEIFTKDQEHLLTTFIAVLKIRLSPANTTLVTFQEEQPASPKL